VFAFLDDKFLGKHLDLRVVRRFVNAFVKFITRSFRGQRNFERLVAADQRIGGPYCGRLRAFHVRPFEITRLLRRYLPEAAPSHRIREMEPGVIRQAAEQFSHFAIAARVHRVGQFSEAKRGLLFEFDSVGEKFLNRFHIRSLLRASD